MRPPTKIGAIEPEPEADLLTPWDAVNALKVDLAALVAGGAPAADVAAIKQRIAHLQAELTPQ
jgi:hypothetical protein